MPENAAEYRVHITLPWVEGPRVPRAPTPRVWAPKLGHPIEVIVLAPFRRLRVHWWEGRHHLHFDSDCPTCPMAPEWCEHGYAAAMVRDFKPGRLDLDCWHQGVVQLTEGPLGAVVFRSKDPWLYTLKRVSRVNGMVETTQRPCRADLFALGRPFDVGPTLTRLYGSCFKSAAVKGGQP